MTVSNDRERDGSLVAALLPSAGPQTVKLLLANSAAVAGRNATAARRPAYCWVICSGFGEPLLYLLSIGVGVGALIGDLRQPDGSTTSYTAFVAPAMLAALSMQGALAETFNFFIKMKYMRLYDAALATPVTPLEVAIGELVWAILRSIMYSLAFLAIMVWTDLITPSRALAVLLAAIAVGGVFSVIGMMLATLIRDSADLDHLIVAQSVLFVFSGTFVPIDSYPFLVRVIVASTPLYHAAELLRGLSGGATKIGALWSINYLLALAAIGLIVCVRRMKAALHS